MKKNQKKQNNFWEIKASANKNEADVFIYGEIVSGDKWYESDVSITEFSKKLDELDNNVKDLNLYVNSPGGSVFTTVAMMSQLQRMKGRMTVNAFVDGIAASAASFLIMVADNIYMYSNSLIMIHKPMLNVFGANSNLLREKADWLDKIEASSCMPAYQSKATDLLTEEVLQMFLGEKDTWLDSNEAALYFDINLINESKDVAACLDATLLYSQENVPKQLKKQPQNNISAEEMAYRNQIAEQSIANQAFLKTILGGL